MKPILFLDFDGVIRIGASDTGANPIFDRDCCMLINYICKETDAKIVVTSDLRRYKPFDELDNLIRLCPIEADHYHHVWKTGFSSSRCKEIYNWLTEYAAEQECLIEDIPFVIFDDVEEHFQMEFVKKNLIQTFYRTGIVFQDAQLAIKILRKSI